MRSSIIFLCLAAVGTAQESEQAADPWDPASTPRAQEKPQPKAQESGTQSLSVRVTQVRAGGIVVIDRGSRDGLAVRDRVVFQPRGRRPQAGRVRLVNERSAEVQLADPSVVFKEGTLGAVRVPNKRLAKRPTDTPIQPVPVPGEHAPWENTDEEYETGMPLLVQIDGVRPEERKSLLSGRVYAIGDVRETSDDGRSDSFYRMGAEMRQENPFGRGGQLTFSGEVNQRMTNVRDQVDESTGTARIDRISYTWGGTRFEPNRHEIGRFLQTGVPEFGIVDGYEWNQRTDTGQRFGATAGFLPEPTPTMTTGNDFGVSGYYQWTADKRERVTATGAYQKTWHDGVADRDLIVGKFDYWATEGWDFHTTTWIDYYTGGDNAKSNGFEFTRILASTGKRWADGDGLNFSYTHGRFPQLDRYEFLPVTQEQLARNRDNRLAADGWTWLSKKQRLHGRLGGWIDQDDSGSDAQVGIEQFGLFHDDARADFRVFGVDGKFSTSYGMRLDYGMQFDNKRWDLSYEYSLNDQVGFTSANDELENHRVIGTFDYTSISGWSLSLNAGAILWTQEFGLSAGFYVQKSF